MFTFRIFSILAIAFGFQVGTSTAFTATSLCQKTHVTTLIGSRPTAKKCQQKSHASMCSLIALNSSPDADSSGDEAEEKSDSALGPSMSLPTSSAQQQPETPTPYVPPPPTQTRNSPPAVRQARMDPLMASLTRDNSNPSPDQPTTNIPIFGEIPADGTLLLLAPAALFAILGFVYSIVIAVNSSDQIVDSLAQAGDSIAKTASDRTNRVYDANVCRGLCSSQQEDIDGLRNFMEYITRGAREAKPQGFID